MLCELQKNSLPYLGNVRYLAIIWSMVSHAHHSGFQSQTATQHIRQFYRGIQ